MAINGITERWAEIPSCPNYYASSLGRIRSNRGILSPYLTGAKPSQYRSVSVKNKNRKVHLLVAECFIPNPAGFPQINHIDGNKENNAVENLERVSASENCLHAHRTGLASPRRGSLNSFAKLTEESVIEIRGRLKAGEVGKELAKEFGVTNAKISQIRLNQAWRHVPCP